MVLIIARLGNAGPLLPAPAGSSGPPMVQVEGPAGALATFQAARPVVGTRPDPPAWPAAFSSADGTANEPST